MRYPTKFMLAMNFRDGTVFVGETFRPKAFIKALLREWRSDDLPIVRVVSRYCDMDDGRGYDLHAKYVARYRAFLAGKTIRVRGLGTDGLPITYRMTADDFRPSVVQAAGKTRWGYGDLLYIEGVTRLPLWFKAKTWLTVTAIIAVNTLKKDRKNDRVNGFDRTPGP